MQLQINCVHFENNHNHRLKMNATFQNSIEYSNFIIKLKNKKNLPFYKPFQTISMISVGVVGMLLSNHLPILNHLFY